MKTIILAVLLIFSFNTSFSQKVNLNDTANVEIIKKNDLIRYKIKNQSCYRNTPFPKDPVTPFFSSPELQLTRKKIHSLLEKQFSEKRSQQLKGKNLYLSFLINSANGKIKCLEISCNSQSKTNLTREEYLRIFLKIQKEITFKVNREYKDWGDINITIKTRL